MAVLATFQAGCDGRPAETLSAGGDPSQGAVAPAPSPNSRESTSIRSLVASEELILQLGTQIDLLNQSALNLCIPDSGSRPLFARRIRVVDLAAAAEGDSSQALPLDLQATDWPVNGQDRLEVLDKLDLWRPMFGRVD